VRLRDLARELLVRAARCKAGGKGYDEPRSLEIQIEQATSEQAYWRPLAEAAGVEEIDPEFVETWKMLDLAIARAKDALEILRK
jgi:hypothetical protein